MESGSGKGFGAKLWQGSVLALVQLCAGYVLAIAPEVDRINLGSNSQHIGSKEPAQSRYIEGTEGVPGVSAAIRRQGRFAETATFARQRTPRRGVPTSPSAWGMAGSMKLRPGVPDGGWLAGNRVGRTARKRKESLT